MLLMWGSVKIGGLILRGEGMPLLLAECFLKKTACLVLSRERNIKAAGAEFGHLVGL